VGAGVGIEALRGRVGFRALRQRAVIDLGPG